jgi:hypothetical protein
MDLKALNNTPPWYWPADTAETLVSVLRDKQAAEPDRVLATEAAISLGPILEYADTEGFEDAGDVPISE